MEKIKELVLPEFKTAIRLLVCDKGDINAYQKLSRGLPQDKRNNIIGSLLNMQDKPNGITFKKLIPYKKDGKLYSLALAVVYNKKENEEEDVDTRMVHEISHVTTIILDKTGIKDDEARSYIFAYLYDKFKELVK